MNFIILAQESLIKIVFRSCLLGFNTTLSPSCNDYYTEIGLPKLCKYALAH